MCSFDLDWTIIIRRFLIFTFILQLETVSYASCQHLFSNQVSAYGPVDELARVPVVLGNESFEVPTEIAPGLSRYFSGPHPLKIKSQVGHYIRAYFGGKEFNLEVLMGDYGMNEIISPGKRLPNSTEDLAILTHQDSKWQTLTVDYLKKSEHLRSVPVLALNSASFPMASKALYTYATERRISSSGEVYNLPPQTKRFHLFGGFCEHCLSDTLNSIMNFGADNTDTKVPFEVYVHSSLVYSNMQIVRPHFKSSLSKDIAEGPWPPPISRHFNSNFIRSNQPGVEVETPFGPALKYDLNRSGKLIYLYVLAK